MTEEEEVQIEEEVKEVIHSLNTQLQPQEDGKVKILYDGESLSRALDKIKNKGEKLLWQSGGELGINIILESRTKTLNELKEIAKESLIYLRDNIPIKSMIGVG